MKEVRSPWSSHRADSVAEQPTVAPSTDNEGEQEMQGLPPIEEVEQPPQATADSENGDPLVRGDPEHLRQFEQLFGRPVFAPNVAGSSMGIVGPGEE